MSDFDERTQGWLMSSPSNTRATDLDRHRPGKRST